MPVQIQYPNFDYSGISRGLTALGQGLGNYATGLQQQRLGNDVATALTSNTPDLQALAQKYAQMGKPDVALKILEYKQTLDAKNSPEWGVNPVTGEYYNKKSDTSPSPAPVGVAPAGATAPSAYPPGVDNPVKQAAFNKSFGTKAGQDTEAVNNPVVAKAKADISNNLGDMLDSYLDLDSLGGTIKPGQTPQENVKAYLGGTGIGQQIQGTGALGDQALQRAGDLQTISQIQPMLINAIRQATHQGARGLDSNVELQFYLKQATDPTYGKYVNLAAIDRLDRAYGLGGLLEGKLSPEELKKVRNTKLRLPQGVKETPLPYDAGQPSPGAAAAKSLGQWAPGSPLPPTPGWYDTPKGRYHYLGNDQWSDQ